VIDLNQVLTFTEAAQKWGLANGSTIRQAALRGKFLDGEVRKSGTVWLTTYDAMVRVFGFPPQENLRLSLNALTKGLQENKADQLKVIQAALKSGKQLQITEYILGKERILYLFQHEKDFLQWVRVANLLPPADNIQK
jgi:hypothetical protein